MSKKKNKINKEFAIDHDKLLPDIDEEIKIKVDSSDTKILHEANEKIKEQKSHKSQIFSISFFLLNIAILVVILIFQLNNDGITSIDDAIIGEVGLRYLFGAFGIFAAIMICDSLRTYIFVRKSTKRHMPIVSYKATATERYYDHITPMSVGGQPFMIYYLSSWKIKPSVATSVPVARLMYGHISLVLTSIVVLLCNLSIFNQINTGNNIVYTISIVSLISIIALIGLIIWLSTSKKIAPKMLLGCLKLGQKMHLVKDYEKSFEKCMRHVLEYQKSMAYFAKDWFVNISVLVLSISSFVLKAIIPYFIYLAMTPNPTVAFGDIFARIMLCDLVARIIPLPGGAGMVELSFNSLFAELFTGGTLFWAMLFYRFFSYYIYLLQGIVIIIYDFIIGNKRRKHRQERVANREERKRLKKLNK